MSTVAVAASSSLHWSSFAVRCCRRSSSALEAAVVGGGKDGHGRGADITEVALVVLAIDCLETFAAKYLIDLRDRVRTIGPSRAARWEVRASLSCASRRSSDAR